MIPSAGKVSKNASARKQASARKSDVILEGDAKAQKFNSYINKIAKQLGPDMNMTK